MVLIILKRNPRCFGPLFEGGADKVATNASEVNVGYQVRYNGSEMGLGFGLGLARACGLELQSQFYWASFNSERYGEIIAQEVDRRWGRRCVEMLCMKT